MRTPSRMVPLGSLRPDLTLVDPRSAAALQLSAWDVRPITVVMFLCNHCPFVIHLGPELGRFATRLSAAGDVAFIAINSNDGTAEPADAAEHMATTAQQFGWDFPYLHDPDQSAAHAFGAACTPDFFVFDRQRRLAYRGQFDASRPARTGLDGSKPITGSDLGAAISALRSGTPVPEPQRPSLGCNIKWKPGNAPAWFVT